MDTVEGVLVPESELVFKASRSSGPGGQNVNKLNTRVTALFDVAGSPSLSEDQKQRILHALSTRVDKDGVLHVASQKHRSQEANRRAAAERVQQLVRDALKPKPVRKDKDTGGRAGTPAPREEATQRPQTAADGERLE